MYSKSVLRFTRREQRPAEGRPERPLGCKNDSFIESGLVLTKLCHLDVGISGDHFVDELKDTSCTSIMQSTFPPLKQSHPELLFSRQRHLEFLVWIMALALVREFELNNKLIVIAHQSSSYSYFQLRVQQVHLEFRAWDDRFPKTDQIKTQTIICDQRN